MGKEPGSLTRYPKSNSLLEITDWSQSTRVLERKVVLCKKFIECLQRMFLAFGGSSKGLSFKELVCGLVLLTRGRRDEKIKCQYFSEILTAFCCYTSWLSYEWVWLTFWSISFQFCSGFTRTKVWCTSRKKRWTDLFWHQKVKLLSASPNSFWR